MALSKLVINIPGEISEKQENYMRLQLLRGLIDKTLREEFHKYFDKNPGLLFSQLQAFKKDIDNLKKKKVISQEQYVLLLPEYGCFVYSEQFDATLLAVLLRNLCGFTYKKNWKPNHNDRSAQANTSRCIDVRNKIQHLPTNVSKKEMSDIFDLIEHPLLDLGATKNEFDGLKIIKIADEATKSTIKKLEESNNQFHYGFQPPVKNFFGRGDELQRLHQLMENSWDKDNFTNNSLGVVIAGMGGVGKSQLARQYCKVHQGNFYSDNCIWINGQNKESMENDFQIIGQRCGITKIKNADGTFKQLSEVVYHVYMHFAKRKDYNSPAKKVLFVFDNIKEQDDLEEFIPNPNYAPYILVTSQFKDWDERFDVLELDVFSNDSAVQFVGENLKPNLLSSTNERVQLSNLLSCHPLALQQALSYVNKTNMSLNDYFKLFQQIPQTMLSSPTKDLVNKSIYKVLSLSIERIKQSNKDGFSVNLLYIMSFLDGKSIQKRLLLKFCNEDVGILNETLISLHKYSIINDGKTDQPFLMQTINIHSLTQYCAHQHQQMESELTHTIESVANVLQKDVESCKRTMKCITLNQWYTHFFYILKNISERHPRILATKDNIAWCLYKMGKFGEALEIYKEVKKIEKEVIGKQHPDYFATKHRIAACLYKMGNYNEALKIYKEVEKIEKEVIGEQHPDYLATKHRIALCLLQIGNYDEALKIYKEVEKIEKEVIGEQHPDYLATKHNFASCLYAMGKVGEALEIYKEVKKINAEVIGEQHPDYLETIKSIATCLLEMGNYDEAMEIYKEVEKIQKEDIGEQHPDYLKTKHGIASCLLQIGNCDEALEIYKEVEKIQKEVNGEQHPDYLATIKGIASCLLQIGNCDEALEIYKEVEKIQKEVIGEQHPNYLITKHGIASCLLQIGNCDEALEIYKEVEKIEKEVIGEQHPDYRTTNNNIVACLLEMGNYNEALEVYKEVEKIEKEDIGEHDPDYRTTKHGIASCLIL